MQFDKKLEASVMGQVLELECLPFPPKTDAGWRGLVRSIIEMANSQEEIDWLIKRIRQGCPACPTPIQMRYVFCQKYTPADHIEAIKLDQEEVMRGRK